MPPESSGRKAVSCRELALRGAAVRPSPERGPGAWKAVVALGGLLAARALLLLKSCAEPGGSTGVAEPDTHMLLSSTLTPLLALRRTQRVLPRVRGAAEASLSLVMRKLRALAGSCAVPPATGTPGSRLWPLLKAGLASHSTRKPLRPAPREPPKPSSAGRAQLTLRAVSEAATRVTARGALGTLAGTALTTALLALTPALVTLRARA
jgi:hypothetical protein